MEEEKKKELPDFMKRHVDIRKKRPSVPMTDIRDASQTNNILVTDMTQYLQKLPRHHRVIQFKYPP